MKKSAVGDRDDDVGGLAAVMVSCMCSSLSSSMLLPLAGCHEFKLMSWLSTHLVFEDGV